MVLLKTDFSDGDVFYSGTTSDNFALNGITNEVNKKSKIKIYRYASVAEVTHTGDTNYYDTNKTFTLTNANNHRILSIWWTATLKNSSASAYTYVSLKLEGTSTGTKYILGNYYPKYGEYASGGARFETFDNSVSSSEVSLTYTADQTSYKVLGASVLVKPDSNNIFLDDDITVTFGLKTESGAATASLKDVEVIITYMECEDVTP